MRTKYFLSFFFFFASHFLKAQNEVETKYAANEREFIEALGDNTKIIITTDTLNFSTGNLEKIMGEKPYVNHFRTAK